MSETNSLEWPAERVRQTFIDYFVKEKQHEFIKSSPVVPHDDPTLLFANAGMNQFKPIFLGTVDPKHPLAKLKRAANSQKCIRAGGKHNDLEDVGKDVYHHTFFEMLGNWSFGDYFKKEAIGWAWELLTKVYKLNPERLYATYFQGYQDVPADEEARQLWLQYLPTERVLPFGMKENFWEMGDTGPCGPCTEIHYDKIGGRDGASLVNADDPSLIEIWNNVFIQFNREADRSLKPLPSQHVDTGMGLERITSILQGKSSNYDTDAWSPIFDAITKASNLPENTGYTGKVGSEDTDNKDMAYRVIADHIRTLTFAITDGAMPGSEGRGYVLRRILRRAVRYGRQVLKTKPGFFSQLTDVVVSQMKAFYPEVESSINHIKSVLQGEESLFEKTLDRGIEHFNKAIKNSKDKKVFSGQDAFTLYDTYGFPLDLTQLMAEELKMTVDVNQYSSLMEAAKELSRKSQSSSTSSFTLLGAEATSQLSKNGVEPTDDSHKYAKEFTDLPANVKAIWSGKGFVDSSEGLEQFGVILDTTNLYSEGGGQIYDTGVIANADGSVKFHVSSVQSIAGYCLHIGKLEGTEGSLKVNDSVKVSLDHVRRRPIMSNHTSTHVINYALREVLGEHIDQKGSLVDHEKLRFDFSHSKSLSEQEILAIEKVCSDIIAAKHSVHRKSTPLSIAKQIHGLRAVFGEVYPDPVTVVSIGPSVDDLIANPTNPEWRKYSVEFCGGTHISNTEEAKHFVIVSEGGISAGVRRIIAWTGDSALKSTEIAEELKQKIENSKKIKENLVAFTKLVSELNNEVKTSPIPLSKKTALLKEIDELSKFISESKKNASKNILVDAERIANLAKENNTQVIIEQLECGSDKKVLGNALQLIKDKNPESGVLLLSTDEKGITIVAAVGKSLSSKLSAAEWCKEVASVVTLNGGKVKSGGKPENAQGGGDDLSKVDEAMKKAVSFATEKVKA